MSPVPVCQDGVLVEVLSAGAYTGKDIPGIPVLQSSSKHDAYRMPQVSPVFHQYHYIEIVLLRRAYCRFTGQDIYFGPVLRKVSTQCHAYCKYGIPNISPVLLIVYRQYQYLTNTTTTPFPVYRQYQYIDSITPVLHTSVSPIPVHGQSIFCMGFQHRCSCRY